MHAELKAEGRTFERYFLLLKGHVIKDHRHIDVSLAWRDFAWHYGLRMSALTEEVVYSVTFE